MTYGSPSLGCPSAACSRLVSQALLHPIELAISVNHHSGGSISNFFQVVFFVFDFSEVWMCLDGVSSFLYLLSFTLLNIVWVSWVCGSCWTSMFREFSLFHQIWLLSLFLPLGIPTHAMSFVAVPPFFFLAILFCFCLFFSMLSIWDVSCLSAQRLFS